MDGERRLLQLGMILLCIGLVLPALAQPIGEEITIIDETPVYKNVEGLVTYTADGPAVLGQTTGDDREPKISILANGTTAVFWVNRLGSHHVNGVDAAGNLVFPTITEDNAADILIGPNTGGNTNWTLNKSNIAGTQFLAAATWKYSQLSGTTAVIPDTVIDQAGLRQDDGQGHGFFKLFNDQLLPISDQPISISQFSAGHREWDCCWLSNGRFVISTASQDHPYAEDPDYSTGGNRIGFINLFNADGTRYKDEMYAVEDMTGSQHDLRLGGLANGFVMVYYDNKSAIAGPSVYKGVVFDNEGNKTKDFLAYDETTGYGAGWMDAGGGSTFVTVNTATPNETIGVPDLMVGTQTVFARLWTSDGEPLTPFIVVTQAADFREVTRERCAMAPNGSFVVTWHDKGADWVDGTESVCARVFNADGTPATDAFLVHDIPEFVDPTTGEGLNGGCGEVFPAINNERVAITWGSRAVPGKGLGTRDIVVMAFKNPAADTEVDQWSLFE